MRGLYYNTNSVVYLRELQANMLITVPHYLPNQIFCGKAICDLKEETNTDRFACIINFTLVNRDTCN
jgi:hypothetical protein